MWSVVVTTKSDFQQSCKKHNSLPSDGELVRKNAGQFSQDIKYDMIESMNKSRGSDLPCSTAGKIPLHFSKQL